MTVSLTWWAVLLAVAVAFVANFVYFGPKTMFPVWWRAMGRSTDAPAGDPTGMGVTFGLVTLALLAQALVVGWLVLATAALYETEPTWLLGAGVGLALGVGIAAATSLGHRLFAHGLGAGLRIWLIEVGGDIIGLLLMGIVLGLWG